MVGRVCENISPLFEKYDDELFFYCPGCEFCHSIKFGAGPGPRWTWNGDANRPTFSPSIRAVTGKKVCHFFVTDGVIQYLSDSTHHLAGITTPMVPIATEDRDHE